MKINSIIQHNNGTWNEMITFNNVKYIRCTSSSIWWILEDGFTHHLPLYENTRLEKIYQIERILNEI
jgi:hypothetical protein